MRGPPASLPTRARDGGPPLLAMAGPAGQAKGRIAARCMAPRRRRDQPRGPWCRCGQMHGSSGGEGDGPPERIAPSVRRPSVSPASEKASHHRVLASFEWDDEQAKRQGASFPPP